MAPRKQPDTEEVMEVVKAPSSVKPVDNKIPFGRWGHTATMVGEKKMLIYGGEGDDDRSLTGGTLGDMWIYDMGKEHGYIFLALSGSLFRFC